MPNQYGSPCGTRRNCRLQPILPQTPMLSGDDRGAGGGLRSRLLQKLINKLTTVKALLPEKPSIPPPPGDAEYRKKQGLSPVE